MMIFTTNGVLRTTETKGQLVALHGRQDIKVAPWYLPIGSHNPDFIRNRLKLLEVYKSCFCDDEYEQFLKWHVVNNGYPTPGIAGQAVEDIIWDKMKDMFYGPIENCPVPNVPEAIVEQWSNFIMYRLTKYGDEPSYDEDDLLDGKQDADDIVAKEIREGELNVAKEVQS